MNAVDTDGLNIRLSRITWGASIGIISLFVAGAMWVQRVETSLSQLQSTLTSNVDDRYRARDARSDLAIRDIQIQQLQAQAGEIMTRLREISLELRELNRSVNRQGRNDGKSD